MQEDPEMLKLVLHGEVKRSLGTRRHRSRQPVPWCRLSYPICLSVCTGIPASTQAQLIKMPEWFDNLKEEAGQRIDNLQESLDDFHPILGGIKEKARECKQAASETMEICNATQEKRQQMIHFASEIVETLTSLREAKNPAEILSAIQELTRGERVREAQQLAKGLDKAALGCVEKAKTMIELMDNSVNSLPGFIRNRLEPKDAHEDLLDGLDKDIEDVETCVRSIKELNLVTAVQSGSEAFEQLSLKAQRSQTLFEKILEFASDVHGFSTAFDNLDVRSLADHGKDIIECLRMTKCLRLVAEGAGRLMSVLISLFDFTADRISALWAALGKAKDCMLESIEVIKHAKARCTDAHTKSRSLLEQSGSIARELDGLDINPETIGTLRKLGQKIQDAVDLAQTMDDLVLDCSSSVVKMVENVTSSVKELPPILTDGLDVAQEGKEDGDPDPAEVEENVATLVAAQRDLEDANFLDATKKGVQGFQGLSDQVTTCTDMLQTMNLFSQNCSKCIDSFIKVWDLEAMGKKITEMCRLVSLGEQYRQFAEQIKKLISAMLAFMKSAIDKLTNLSLGDIGSDLVENAGEALQGVVGDAGQDIVDGAVDMVKNKLDKFNIFK